MFLGLPFSVYKICLSDQIYYQYQYIFDNYNMAISAVWQYVSVFES